MKNLRLLLSLFSALFTLSVSAQLQWYQNQDAGNTPPYGTIATSIQPFSASSFVACYLWQSDNENNTWKLSKTGTNGQELNSFFLTGISSNVEFKKGNGNTVYLLERSFTPAFEPLYTLYKLDHHLQLQSQKTISFPNGFTIYSLNAFELDDQNNIYLAGDGGYTRTDGGTGFASFVMKSNKNLVTAWSRMDSIETTYSRLHIDRWGRVLVIQDNFLMFPQVRISRFSATGQPLPSFTTTTDAGRISLSSLLDDEDHLLFYGAQTNPANGQQSIYVKRISKSNGNTLYEKTYLPSASLQLEDVRLDHHSLFVLATQQPESSQQKNKIVRINATNGTVNWTRTIEYSSDSCNLHRLIVNDGNELAAIGERNSCSFFTKGAAIRIRKNGQQETSLLAPDSVNFQRSHTLADAIFDNSGRLIVIGTTTNLDTTTMSNSYFRSFAARFNSGNTCYGKGVEEETVVDTDATSNAEAPAMMTEEKIALQPQVAIYPNPVQEKLTVTNIDPQRFDKISVFNMQGALLQQQRVNGNQVQLDMTQLQDGVYLLVLRSLTRDKDRSIKFIVKK